MSKLKILCVLGVLSTALAMMAWGQTKPTTPTHSEDELAGLMRAKLASSQKVVEGLMASDFDLIRRGAEEMVKVCDATKWHATDDQVYSHYRADLRRNAKKLILLAEDKNLEGSSYLYMNSLTTCISCHEHCRHVLHIAENGPDLRVIPIPTTEPENNSDRTRLYRR